MSNVPDAVVGFLLNNITEFVKYNANLIGGQKENVNNLCQELNTLRAFLKECRENYDDSFLESLANEIRDVVYQAEDVIETYIAYVSRQKLRSPVDKALHAIDYVRELRRVGKQMQEVTKKVQRFYQEKAQLGFEAMKIAKMRNTAAERRKAPVFDDNVVGFDDEADKLYDLLTKGSEQLEVISIIGMLGLGKTTLARKVYKDPRIEYEFFIRAFINVSQDYKRSEVFLKILRAFTKVTDEMQKMSDDELAEKIREYLKNRQYLIVMDDVWSSGAWEDLKAAFPSNNRRSRILITTRTTPVARCANPKIDAHHYLRFMYKGESRELFRRKVFGENVSSLSSQEMEEYEIRILERCKGLPLAVVVVAGILVNHQNESHWWKKVAQGMDQLDPKDLKQTHELIKLSFDSLPYSLKPCFLYLGVFREDSEIPAGTLLPLWTAEGFVPRDDSKGMEVIAEEYLEDLVDRNLVMVGQRKSNGRIKTCMIHDTLRDFCKREGKAENLFREIKMDGQSSSSSGSNAFDKDRRICINSYVEEYIKLKPSAKYARSFLSFAKGETTLPTELILSIPKAFNLLRVLDIKSIKLTRIHPEFWSLVLLKYMAICCDLNVLPGKISNLWNLQTLVVKTSARSLEIKADIWKMAQLRHLYTNVSTALQKSNEPFLIANLRTLCTISPESCTKEVIERTCRTLTKLGIRGRLAILFETNSEFNFLDNLSKLESLENLKLLNENATSKLHALPSENKFPINLTKLTLLNTSLDWRHMSTLGKLGKLQVLKLKDNAFWGELWVTEDGGFRSLKVLHIGSTNLVEWRASANSFPILTSLFLRHCTKLEAVPPSLVDVPSLQSIDLYCTNSSVATSARKLQVARLQVQAQDKGKKSSGFKLSVYPPDE